MLDAADVERIAGAGGRLIVMPHADHAVIRAAKAQGLLCVPGVATPTEAFGALAAGADALKLFPAEALPPAVVKAWRAVLPADVWLLPVGGITPDSMARLSGGGRRTASASARRCTSGVRARPRSAAAPTVSRPPSGN